jgi:hypothetical protein
MGIVHTADMNIHCFTALVHQELLIPNIGLKFFSLLKPKFSTLEVEQTS